MSNRPAPRLIETPDYTGYYLSDIHEALTRAQRAVFAAWYGDERARVFHNGRAIIFADDWEWFLALERQQLRAAEDEEAEVEAADGEGCA